MAAVNERTLSIYQSEPTNDSFVSDSGKITYTDRGWKVGESGQAALDRELSKADVGFFGNFRLLYLGSASPPKFHEDCGSRKES
jgi:hypothetical protein